MPHISPKVSFVIVHLDQEDATRECIRSLLHLSYENIEIVLVDNCSTDASGERLHKEFPGAVFIRNEENLGFAEGNNVGIRKALAEKADYVVLLNNDTVVEQNFVQPLLGLAQSDRTIGVQSCKIYFFADPEKLWYAGGILNTDTATGIHRGMFASDSERYNKIEDTGYATGCMMFIARSALETVGLFDSAFFIYLEDADWCERARRSGYRVVYNPGAWLRHKVSVTTKIDSPFYLYFTARNKILFLRKHARRWRLIVHLPHLLYFYGRHIVRMSIKWRSYVGTRAVLFGIVDGLRNYTGGHGEGRLSAVQQR
jgi:GT2 family glycosyltransferase